MRQDQRLSLRRRFRFGCGYCGVSERDAGAELTVDHFQPLSRGGADVEENWVYWCHACNEFKGSHWQPASASRILHPLGDNKSTHLLELEDGTLQALSDIGAFHIERLQLNRRPLIGLRYERRLLKSARQAQAILLEKAQQLEEKLRDLTAQLENLEGEP